MTTQINPLSRLLNTLAAVLSTASLLALCTWGELALQDIAAVKRPYTIFYLIPVVVGAALLGIRGGILTALAAVLLARFYLFTDNKHGWELISFPNLVESIEFSGLLLGTLTIAFITGRLRSTLSVLKKTNENLVEANDRLIESEQQRRLFNRDVLLAVTGGKLRLFEHDEMPPLDLVTQTPKLKQTLCVPADASALRQTLNQLGRSVGMDRERIGDLCTATTEAATNAIKHGNGGTATIWCDLDSVTVQIEDRGTGIAPAHLARATLEQGYSTRVSLGMGFHLMLQATDALALCTDSNGTIIFLQVSNKPRQTAQEAVLAQYACIA